MGGTQDDATTAAVYATKDAVTSVADSVKQRSVQTLAILKAGVAAALEERAKQRVGALNPHVIKQRWK